MSYRVRLAIRAIRDAAATISFIRRKSGRSAMRWHAALVEAVLSLEDHPERCELAPEAEMLGIELRQRLFGKRRNVYRILFIVVGQVVNVVHIRHAARKAWRPRDL
jgi:hypothetical protein